VTLKAVAFGNRASDSAYNVSEPSGYAFLGFLPYKT
jgi:hypothetical protein